MQLNDRFPRGPSWTRDVRDERHDRHGHALGRAINKGYKAATHDFVIARALDIAFEAGRKLPAKSDFEQAVTDVITWWPEMAEKALKNRS